MKIQLLAITSLAALANSALGQPFVAAQLGYSSAEFPVGPPFNGSVDDNALTYGVDVGMGLGEDWAIELGWNGYDGFDGRATPCPEGAVCPAIVVDVPNNDQRIYRLALVRRFSLGDADLFGKAGYYHAKLDGNIDLPSSDSTENGLMLGIGVRWYFDDPWSVSVEASRHDDNVSQFTVGFGWGMRRTAEDREEEIEERTEERTRQ
jgi:hypothetical protein